MNSSPPPITNSSSFHHHRYKKSNKSNTTNGGRNGGKTTTSSRSTTTLPRKITESKSLELVASPLGPIATPAISTVDRDILLDRLRIEVIDRYHFSLASPSSSFTKAGGGKSNQNGKRKTNDTRRTDNCVTKRRRHKKIIGTIEERNDRNLSSTPKNIFNNDVFKTIIHTTNSQNNALLRTIRNRIVIGANQCTRVLESARTAQIPPPQSNDEVESTKTNQGPYPSLVFLARDVRPPIILTHIPILCRLLSVPLILFPGNASSELGKLIGVKTASILLFFDDGGGVPLGYNASCANEAQNKCMRQINSYIEFAKDKVLY